MTGRTFGWRAPARGHLGASRAEAGAGELDALPVELSLEAVEPEITDQLALGSCTGHATARALAMRLRWQLLGDWTPSPLDLYLGGRAREGAAGDDAGATLADVLAHAREAGFAPDALWPYAERWPEFRGPAPEAVRAARGRTRLLDSTPLDWHLDTLRWFLACGFPLVVGVRVFESFERTGGDGVVAMPAGRELGGHALAVSGYSDARRAFRVPNSWGRAWGDRGRCWLPYDYVLSPVLCGEIHALGAVREGNP